MFPHRVSRPLLRVASWVRPHRYSPHAGASCWHTCQTASPPRRLFRSRAQYPPTSRLKRLISSSQNPSQPGPPKPDHHTPATAPVHRGGKGPLSPVEQRCKTRTSLIRQWPAHRRGPAAAASRRPPDARVPGVKGPVSAHKGRLTLRRPSDSAGGRSFQKGLPTAIESPRPFQARAFLQGARRRPSRCHGRLFGSLQEPPTPWVVAGGAPPAERFIL